LLLISCHLKKEKKFAYVKYNPQQVTKLLEEGGGIIDELINKMKVKRIAIDSITAFTLIHKDELAVREALLSLFEMISGWGCTTMLTAEQESDPVRHKPGVVEFEVDSVILLYSFVKKSIRQRAAEILKMRGTKFTPKIFPMEIGSKGVVFYPGEFAL